MKTCGDDYGMRLGSIIRLACSPSTGILLVRQSSTIADVVEYLVLGAYAAYPTEYQDAITYIP
jgi:hypothetical protein